jgi:hypothetical protein
MKDEAWRSVAVVNDSNGEPHVLQQKVSVYTDGLDAERPGYTSPEMKHRLVPMRKLIRL